MFNLILFYDIQKIIFWISIILLMLFSLPARSTRRPIVTPVIRIRVPITLRIHVPVTLRWSFIFKFLKSSFLENHSSESIHIWTLGTLEDPLSFHDCFSVMQTIYADSWSDISWPCDIDLCVMNWRSACAFEEWIYGGQKCQNLMSWLKCRSQRYFYGPVILPYVFNSIWWINVILWDNESVWCNFWPRNKFRSQWTIYHGPVILSYVLKTIGWMNIMLWNKESVWQVLDVGQNDIYFMVHWFCLAIEVRWFCFLLFIASQKTFYWQGAIQASYTVMQQLLLDLWILNIQYNLIFYIQQNRTVISIHNLIFRYPKSNLGYP